MTYSELKISIVELVRKKCERDIVQLQNLGGELIPEGYTTQNIIDFFDKKASAKDVERALLALTEERRLFRKGRDCYIDINLNGGIV